MSCFVQRVDPFEPIVSGDTPDEQADYLERYTAWVRRRLGAMLHGEVVEPGGVKGEIG